MIWLRISPSKKLTYGRDYFHSSQKRDPRKPDFCEVDKDGSHGAFVERDRDGLTRLVTRCTAVIDLVRNGIWTALQVS